jgi:LPXTG-motif cell wall-anchored protein
MIVRRIFGVIFILGGLFSGLATVAFWQKGEQVAGIPAALPAAAGAVVGLLIGILLFRRKKQKG